MSKKSTRENRNFRFETLQLHVGQETPDPATDSRVTPIYQTATYVFDNCEDARARFNLSKSANIYNRLGNPTAAVVESRIAALEGGIAALALASGQAAVTYSIMASAKAGDHILSANNIYG
jgi:O-acetylhomoserine (thiol)-lyase